MNTASIPSTLQREPALLGQMVVVIGGSSGIGLDGAPRPRRGSEYCSDRARNPERLKRAAIEMDALSTAGFGATDPVALESFFGFCQ